jgi:pseudouridine synthase
MKRRPTQYRAGSGKSAGRGRTFLLYKPYGVLSQFTDPSGRQTLAGFGPFGEGVYPVGRLDYDSEGLLVLTDDNQLKQMLLEPRYEHPKTYLVQVERVPDPDALNRLRTGILLDGKMTRPADVRLLESEPALPARSVPIRFRKNVPTAWLELTIREGRNRQVRKMTAAVGHPALRLVRTGIGGWKLGDMTPGEVRKLPVEIVEDLKAGMRSGSYRK